MGNLNPAFFPRFALKAAKPSDSRPFSRGSKSYVFGVFLYFHKARLADIILLKARIADYMVLSFGKTQIHLVFRSLIRIFAIKVANLFRFGKKRNKFLCFALNFS